MANSMIKNNNNNNNNNIGNIVNDFIKFAKDFKASGKDPKKYLDELINSGKFNKNQINEAIKKAKEVSSFFSFFK